MEIVYILDEKEAEQVTFIAQFICDRQTRPGYMKDGIEYEESYANKYHREDMFWIRPKLCNKELGAYCVVPRNNPADFEIHMNWCHIAPDSVEYRVRERAAKWFKETPEYQQQIEWVTKLREMQAEDIKNGFVTRPKQGKSKS